MRFKCAYAHAHTRDVSPIGAEEKIAGGEGLNSGRVSGGHLRLGHFVLSPCSVFSVVRRRKETGHLRAGVVLSLSLLLALAVAVYLLARESAVALFYKRLQFLMISRVKRN